jgi:hypothetical protein
VLSIVNLNRPYRNVFSLFVGEYAEAE